MPLDHTLNPQALFADLIPNAPIVVAVSGGSDSIALLHLVSAWATDRNAEIQIVTVDHGLRPEAAAEAGFVAGVCEGLGRPHYTIAWEGIKPTSGVSDASRNARYRLISEFARDIGAKTIVTGHTLNDQAETVWMRNSRNPESTGYRGLAGMSRRMAYAHDVEVLRPLLHVSRNQLRHYLVEMGQTWIEDPSNFDLSYERVRARQALTQSAISVDEIARFAKLCGRLRRHDCERVGEMLVDMLSIGNGPVYSVPCAPFFAAGSSEHSLLALQVVVAIAGGQNRFISRKTAVECIQLSEDSRMTAGGCIVERKGSEWLVYRENRNLPLIMIDPGEMAVWDGRLEITNATGGIVVCRSVDSGDLAQFEEQTGEPLCFKPKLAGASTPIIQNSFGEFVLPFADTRLKLDGVSWQLVSPCIEHYRPDFDTSLFDLLNYVRTEIEMIKQA